MSDKPELPALDPASVQTRSGASYPAPFDEPCRGRHKQALGNAVGLTQYGVNLVRIDPGAWSAQRHWHSAEDEFVYVLEGELVLVTDLGERTLGPGMAAGFPAGQADGHCLINRSGASAAYLEVGTRSTDDAVTYPDIDLAIKRSEGRFTNKKGEPY